MKKLIIGLVLVIAVAKANTLQDKMAEKRARYYTEECAREFSLNGDQKAKLYQLKLEQIRIKNEFMSRYEAGEFNTEDEYRKNRQKALRPINAQIVELSGGTHQDFALFAKRIRPEMQKLKQQG